MFTVLNIEERFKKGLCGGIVKRLPVNSVKQRCVQNGDYTINYIDYVSRNGRVAWKRIERRLKKTGGEVVYCSSAELPEDSSIHPFVPFELRQRLCSNMTLEVLSIMKEVPKNLRVGVYDTTGDFADLVPFLLKYTDNVVVVTKNIAVYSDLSKSLLSSMGAVLRVHRSASALCTCGFIIAPCVIKDRFTPMSKAVVLTCDKPKVALACSVYYKYSFRLPKELDKLRAEEVDTEVFGGALYSLCGVYGVGSLVPFVCTNNENSQTTLSLKKYLEEQFTS